jgi:hypothetical protein
MEKTIKVDFSHTVKLVYNDHIVDRFNDILGQKKVVAGRS